MISIPNKQNQLRNMFLRSLPKLLAVLVVLAGFTQQARAQSPKEMSFVLRDGSVVRVAPEEDTFDWKTVATDGTITHGKYNVSDIQSLKFTESPASDEVARIRGLVAKLASDNYRDRHHAESTLLEQGKPFEEVIDQAMNHNEPEVRYRVRRIMKFLEKQSDNNVTRFALDFDILTLKNGTILEGDIGDWGLRGKWNGDQVVTFNRKNCVDAMTQPSFGQFKKESNTVEMTSKIIMNPKDVFQSPEENDTRAWGQVNEGYRVVDFDVGSRGEKMAIDKSFDVGDLFAFRGCVLNCESNNGSVVISGYKFKKSRSRNRSVGNLFINPVTRKKARYKGVMRIDFCAPGNKQLPASVNMAGFFAEIVEPRETIVEAYNADGHIIGLAQSAVKKNSFLGIESGHQIAYLKISKNIYTATELTNVDFAVDDLTYSDPIVSSDINYSDLVDEGTPHIAITTRDEQRFLVDSIKFAGEKLELKSSIADLGDFELPIANVAWIAMPQNRNSSLSWWRADGTTSEEYKSLGWWNPTEHGVFVMLTNGSVVHCQLEQNNIVSTISNQNINADDVIGTWNARELCRYPQSGDFEHGDMVMVRPLNRVAFAIGEFDWGEGAFSYERDGAKSLEQAMALDDNPTKIARATLQSMGIPGEDDPGQIEFSNSTASFWRSSPPTLSADSGLIRTNDGQRFVIGGDDGFELVKMDGQQVVIKIGETEVPIELSKVHALNLSK